MHVPSEAGSQSESTAQAEAFFLAISSAARVGRIMALHSAKERGALFTGGRAASSFAIASFPPAPGEAAPERRGAAGESCGAGAAPGSPDAAAPRSSMGTAGVGDAGGGSVQAPHRRGADARMAN